jgi:amidase
MFNPPNVKRIVEVAESLGFHISGAEAEIYQPVAEEQLRVFYDFVESRMEEEHPPLLFPERVHGYRPTLDEDPYRAWLWKCRIGGKDEGLLAGKTVSFKDHISVAGIPEVFTSQPMEGFVPDVDATVVTRVLAAGGTVVGKHMMNGFMGDFGAPLNPHDISRVTGGSSTGSGAALAAGEVDISFGGDQGGSIRGPAAYCGVLGLKPTFGLVSHFAVGFGSEQSVDHVGPMARRVEDMAAALEAVAGYDGYDPRQSRLIPETFPVVEQLDRGVKGLRIGILEEGFADPIEPEVADGVLEAVDVLVRAGAEVTKISVPEQNLTGAVYNALTLEGTKALRDTSFYGMWAKTYYPTATIVAMDKMWQLHADMASPRAKVHEIVAAISRQDHHGAVYAKAQNVRSTFVKAFDKALAEVDVLVMPNSKNVAPPIPDPLPPGLAGVEAVLHQNRSRMAYSNRRTADYTGHPALAVPCGKVGGLPIGMQLVGRFLDDAVLLRVAYAYQESVDWSEMTAVRA